MKERNLLEEYCDKNLVNIILALLDFRLFHLRLQDVGRAVFHLGFGGAWRHFDGWISGYVMGRCVGERR